MSDPHPTPTLTQGRLDREIVRLALPAVVATVTTPLLSLVDTAFTGHMGSPVYLGAIAVGGNLFNMLFWLFGFLRMGVGALTAQAYGAGDFRAARRLLRRCAGLALALGVALIALERPIEALFGRFMEADPDVWRQAVVYVRILIWGAPAVLLSYVAAGWFLGMQSTKSAMWMSIAIDAVNIGASSLLVLGLHMRVEGVAYGTLAAQWLGLAVAAVAVARLLRTHPAATPRRAADISWGRLFRVNTDILLRTACLIAVTLWFTRAGAMEGPVLLAANALLLQFFILFSYFMDGLAYAGEALTGRLTGAADREGARRAIRRLMFWGACLAAAFTLAYFVAGEAILRLLSDNDAVRAAAADHLAWAASIPLVGFAAFMWDGIFIGATLTRRMLLAMAIATAVFFAVWAAATPAMGNHGLWLAFIAYLATRSLAMTLLRPRA